MNKIEKMSLGRREAYLRRCMQVIELVEKHETDVTIRCRIFQKHIYPVMRCSYATFNNMLNEPNPRMQLQAIINKKTGEPNSDSVV